MRRRRRCHRRTLRCCRSAVEFRSRCRHVRGSSLRKVVPRAGARSAKRRVPVVEARRAPEPSAGRPATGRRASSGAGGDVRVMDREGTGPGAAERETSSLAGDIRSPENVSG